MAVGQGPASGSTSDTNTHTTSCSRGPAPPSSTGRQLPGMAAGGAAGAAPGPSSAPPGQAPPPLVAGLGRPLQELRELVVWPGRWGEAGAGLGVVWPRGALLHGPPGCGKSLLVKAVAEEAGASLHVVSPGDVFGAFLGESERRLREAFAAAAEEAAQGRTVVVFLDEVDALCPRRDSGRPHEARVVAQLLTLLDGAAGVQPAHPTPLPPPSTTSAPGVAPPTAGAAGGGQDAGGQGAPGRVVVLAATNRPSALDPALRRPGRLEREVAVPVPDEAARADILRLHTRGLALAPDLDLAALAAACTGYSGADLAALAREAAMAALATDAAAWLAGRHQQQQEAGVEGQEQQQQQQGVACTPEQQVPGRDTTESQAVCHPGEGLVTAGDFLSAMTRVGPSIMRGAAAELQPVSWEDIGGYPSLKQRLQQVVEWPLRHAPAFTRLGLAPPKGVLLHGPPGCAKTLLARAAATASRATFLALSCAQLYSMYVGEGEALLRDTFSRARQAAPAVLLLDEADALAPAREAGSSSSSSSGGGGGPEPGVRLLSTLLTELDGLEAGGAGGAGVLLLAATNRPAGLDPALLRPGRLDVLLYVPPPDREGRLEVLRLHTRSMPLAPDVDLGHLADTTQRFTGAELAGLCREAALAALREDVAGATQVAARHFAAARAGVNPALSEQELQQYEAWGKQYGR